MPRALYIALSLMLCCPLSAHAASVDPAAPYAWCENAGWLDAYAGGSGLVVPDGQGPVSGFAWLENVGWVNFGSGFPLSAPYYGNSVGEDSGVNYDGAGNLFGLAWGENIGWINFGTEGAPLVYLAPDGSMSGYAWGENIGWISIYSSQGIVMILPPQEGEGIAEGGPDGTIEGIPEGVPEGASEGTAEGVQEGFIEGIQEGVPEGIAEGLLEGSQEGIAEGVTEGITEAAADGEAEGTLEGESPFHSADSDHSGTISLTELLRVVQLYNAEALSCATPGETEDGYQLFVGDESCPRHDSDYESPLWQISLSELLRLVQLYNVGGYAACQESEDHFCLGK